MGGCVGSPVYNAGEDREMKTRHVQHNKGRRLRGWMGRWVPVARGFRTTGSGVWGGCGGGVGVGGGVCRLRVIGGAVKEGEGGYVAVDGKDFGKEIPFLI